MNHPESYLAWWNVVAQVLGSQAGKKDTPALCGRHASWGRCDHRPLRIPSPPLLELSDTSSQRQAHCKSHLETLSVSGYKQIAAEGNRREGWLTFKGLFLSQNFSNYYP